MLPKSFSAEIKMYDKNNIFAKIISKEIPCDLVYEDDKVMFFNDINPQAKIHILGIPKKEVRCLSEYILNSTSDEVIYFFNKVSDIVSKFNLDKTGYRLITNEGRDSNQEVPHFHIHILGGENLGGLR